MLKRQVVRLFPEANYAVLECAGHWAHYTQDKIIRKQVFNGMPIERYTLEDEVLFGVNINGKIAYVPKEVYEKLQGYVAPNKWFF